MANSWINVIALLMITTAITAILSSLLKNKRKSNNNNNNNNNNNCYNRAVLPPGPKGLPILGNLHMLGDLPHQGLHKLSQKYGPIMHIRLGQVPTIVVSSPAAAELFLKTHDLAFASRPLFQASKYMSYMRKGLVFTEYGSYWREIRKLLSLELLTRVKIEMFKPIRREEVRGLVEVVKAAAGARKVVCVSEMVEKVLEDITYRMVFGCKDHRFDFKAIIGESMELMGAFNIGDHVPFLAPFDIQAGLAAERVTRERGSERALIWEFLLMRIPRQERAHLLLCLSGGGHVSCADREMNVRVREWEGEHVVASDHWRVGCSSLEADSREFMKRSNSMVFSPKVMGLVRRMKKANKKFDEFLEKIIEEHVRDAKEQEGQVRDFIGVMLSMMEEDSMKEVKFGKDNIKAIILDVLTAAMDTSVNVINWAIPELLRHPKLMKRVQDELREVVGMDRMVEETDLPKLNYLNMVIKETMRLHPVGPLLVPRESIEDVTINGYFIPKKSRVLVNIWTIGRDPNAWSKDAEEFNPDRFMDVDIDIHGRDFQLIPFGSGRRKCPGMQLGLVVVQLILAQLLHCFNWELPNGMSPCDLDMKEKLALTMSRASHLNSIPSYRLNV
ncbi:hypothetical protein Sjap_024408 [Stephania japonica]|uniref:Cytochrome P450 n=1 Tax=Stephania japonica TaxID=461633 RepID=A0AAP0HNY0_9MAGN